MIMDKVYEGDETRQVGVDVGMEPVVPPKRHQLSPWEYTQEIYKKCNEVERLFRRLKGAAEFLVALINQMSFFNFLLTFH